VEGGAAWPRWEVEEGHARRSVRRCAEKRREGARRRETLRSRRRCCGAVLRLPAYTTACTIATAYRESPTYLLCPLPTFCASLPLYHGSDMRGGEIGYSTSLPVNTQAGWGSPFSLPTCLLLPISSFRRKRDANTDHAGRALWFVLFCRRR